MLRVAGAVIESDEARDDGGWCLPEYGWAPGRVMIARRREGLRHAGLWELPGGKIEANEDAAGCLVRELREELGIAVEVGEWVATNVHDYGHGPLALEAWRCRWVAGRLVPSDHDAVAWVEPTALLEFELAAADVPLAEALSAAARG